MSRNPEEAPPMAPVMALVNVNIDGELICRMGSKLVEGCRSIKGVALRYRRDSNVKSILKALASTESGSIALKSIDVEGVPWPLLRAAAVRGEVTDKLIEACLDSEAAWKIRDEAFHIKSRFAKGALRDVVDRLRSGLAFSDIIFLSIKICSAEFDNICDIPKMLAMVKRRFGNDIQLFVGDMALIKAIETKARDGGDENVEVLSGGVPIFEGEVFGSLGIVRWHPESGAVFSYKDRRARLNWKPDSRWDTVISKLRSTNTDREVMRVTFDRLVGISPQAISTSEERDILYLIKEVLERRDIYAEDAVAISDAICDQLTLHSRFAIGLKNLTGANWMSLNFKDRREEQKNGALSPGAKEKVESNPERVVELIREALQVECPASKLHWGMSMFNSSGSKNAEEVLGMHNRYLEGCKQNTDMREKQRGMHLSVLAARRMYHSTYGQGKDHVHLTYGLEKSVSMRYPTKTEFKDVVVMYAPGAGSAYVYIIGEDVLSTLSDTKRQPFEGHNPSMLACARLLLSLATQRADRQDLVRKVEEFLAKSLSAIFDVHDFLLRKMFGQAGEIVKVSDIVEEATIVFGDGENARKKINWATVEVMSMLASMGSVDSSETIGRSCLYTCLGTISNNIVADVAKINLDTTPDLGYVEVRKADGQMYIALDTDKKKALIISGFDSSLTEEQARRKTYHATVGLRPNEEGGVTRMRFVSLKLDS